MPALSVFQLYRGMSLLTEILYLIHMRLKSKI